MIKVYYIAVCQVPHKIFDRINSGDVFTSELMHTYEESETLFYQLVGAENAGMISHSLLSADKVLYKQGHIVRVSWLTGLITHEGSMLLRNADYLADLLAYNNVSLKKRLLHYEVRKDAALR